MDERARVWTNICPKTKTMLEEEAEEVEVGAGGTINGADILNEHGAALWCLISGEMCTTDKRPRATFSSS